MGRFPLFALLLTLAVSSACLAKSTLPINPIAALDVNGDPKPEAKEPPMREAIRSLARSGRLDSAFQLARRAYETDSLDAFAIFMMAKLSLDGKQSSEYFRKVIAAGKSNPETEESHFRLGQYYYAAGKYFLAIPAFREYLRRFPNGAWQEPAHYWMGNACLSYGQRPEKAAYLDSGLAYFQGLLDRIGTDSYYGALALEGIAKSKASKEDRQGAWEAVRTAMEKAPEDERSPIFLMAAQSRRGLDREEEKRLVARILKEFPQSLEAGYLRRINGTLDPTAWRAGAQPLVKAAAPDTVAAAAPASAGSGNTHDTLAARTAAPGSGAGKGYTLQLGAFSQAANAQAMMADLTKQGLSPILAESARGDKRLFQIRLGQFASLAEAEAYAREHLKPRKLLSQPVPLP